MIKEDFMDSLDILEVFDELTVECEPTKRHTMFAYPTDIIMDETDREEDVDTDALLVPVFLLFEDNESKVNDKNIEGIINREPIYFDGKNYDWGPTLGGNNNLFNLIYFGEIYDADSVKEILLNDDDNFNLFLDNIDNNNNMKLMKGLGLNVKKIRELVSDYTLDKDINNLMNISKPKVDKQLLNRVLRRHSNNKRVIDIFNKYDLWKYTEFAKKHNIDYTMNL